MIIPEPRPVVAQYAEVWPPPAPRGIGPRRPAVTVPGLGARPKPPVPPRRAGFALTMLVVLALLATFFAWVTAEPLWLAVGHADRGTATVTACSGSGVVQRCVGAFTVSDGTFTVEKVAMLGVGAGQRQAGTAIAARMVAAHRCGDTPAGCRAYMIGHPGVHLRWAAGLLLVLLCGFGIAWATGAFRLDRGRLAALAASLGGPVLLALGFLVAAW